jgi:hypothetical protein
MGFGQAQGCAPGVLVGFAVNLDGQLRQIGERSVKKLSVVTLAACANLQNVGGWPASPSVLNRMNRVPHFSRFLREVGLLTFSCMHRSAVD